MQVFRSATASAGSAATLTFPKLPGKKYRILGFEASTFLGAVGSDVTITGIDGAAGLESSPDTFDVEIEVDVVQRGIALGLLSKENTDFVFTLAALASSVPKLNVWCSVENA